MKIELYSFPNCEHSLKIEEFLQKNNLKFRKIIVDNEQAKKEIKRLIRYEKNVSFLKIIKNHSISIITGFDEFNLNKNLLEHIQKYNPKIEI